MSADEKNNNGDGIGLDMLMDVPMELSVEVGRTRVAIQKLLALGPGNVVELDKLAGEPLDIYVNGRLIARGETVAVGDKFGVRITSINPPDDRLENP